MAAAQNQEEFESKFHLMNQQTDHLRSIIHHQKLQIEELQNKLIVMDSKMTQSKKDTEEAVPRHDVGDVKSYLSGVKYYLQEMEKENDKIVKEYHTILDQFQPNA